MKFVQKLVGRSRVRNARQELARDPSPLKYVQLARECAAAGMVREARRVCEEGLAVYPGSTELKRMFQRARRIEGEERLSELRAELAEAPRPALWREMCDVLLDTGQVAEAERQAAEWLEAAEEGDPDARAYHARTLLEVFLSDLSRQSGMRALDVLDAYQEQHPRDPRGWELRLRLMSAIGAWREARRSVAQLLGLRPGDPELEARFRALDSVADGAPEVSQAFVTVERTGELANEKRADTADAGSVTDVRPLLRRLAADSNVHAAFYVRGGTALVQGTKGATAERAARSVRSVLKTSRSAARRLGLGHVHRVELEGSFGTLAVVPGEMDAGAVWCKGAIAAETERGLLGIAGLNAAMEDEA
ncbi:MAG: hypothetical protein AAF682_15300 [Planctomycetota bacterium]